MDAIAAEIDGVASVDTWTPMLDALGIPREELYAADRLHLSAEGYAVWSGVLRPRLRPPAAGTADGG